MFDFAYRDDTICPLVQKIDYLEVGPGLSELTVENTLDLSA